MGKKNQRLCKWNGKEIEKRLDRLAQIVKNPVFLCLKCARVAGDPQWLHKPVRIKPE